MNIDIRTTIFFTAFISLLILITLFFYYKIGDNHKHKGLKWLINANLLFSLGYFATLLRELPTIGNLSIIANNLFFISGISCLYLSVLAFLEKQVKIKLIILVILMEVFVTFYFTYFQPNLTARLVNFSIAMAFVAFLSSYLLFNTKTVHLKASCYFIGSVLLFQGLFFSIRIFVPLITHISDFFSPSLIQILTFIVSVFVNILSTFGFIILMNQKLNHEFSESQKNTELILNTIPDAVLLTRIDGLIISVNNAFSFLSGYERNEAIGKNIENINLYHNLDDRKKVLKNLKEFGFCNNLEAVFNRKNGESSTGLLSAKIIHLLGEPHILSITRDISERKKAENQIASLLSQLELEKKYAETNAITDSLTKISNRRWFDESLITEFYRLKRSGEPLSLIMIDIDYFKKYNDTYGHIAGDDCLRQVGATLKSIISRAQDVVARYGGEEFAIILPETNNKGALVIAERILTSIELLHIPHKASNVFEFVTVSIGVATSSTLHLASPENIIDFADQALYNAKHKGRNRIELYNAVSNNSKPHNDFLRLIWHSNDECGNETIDNEHRQLFEISNNLLSKIIIGAEKEECITTLEDLLKEITQHFMNEEKILRVSGFPFIDNHLKRHDELLLKANILAEKYKRDELNIGEIFSFIAYDVVAQHIYIEDKKYFPYIRTNSV